MTEQKRRSLSALGLDLRLLPDRQEYLNELRDLYDQGLISVDEDDPRSVIGLTKAEIKYIRSEQNGRA